MKYTIKRGAETVATVRPTGSYTRKIMAEETAKMTFSLPKFVKFYIGDTVEIDSALFVLNKEPNVVKVSTKEYQFDLTFESVKYELAKVQLFTYGDDNSLKEADFSVTANAKTLLDLIIKNANRVQGGWTAGVCDDTDVQTLTFNSTNCLLALNSVATQFKLEFWVKADKSIHLTEIKNASGLTLEYGKAKGFKSLTRSNIDQSNVVTRLHFFGSTKNIPSNYRNYSKRLRTASGNVEKNIDRYGLIEATQIFENIYPRRIGTVSAVGNIYTFTDNTIDFDVNNQLIPDTTAKLTFTTGQLGGYTFEIVRFNYATKTFEIKENEDEKAYQIPNESIKAAIGDKYVLTDIIMPQTYITAAEVELQAEAERYLNENSIPKMQYAGVCDPIYFAAQNIRPNLGDTVHVVDADFGIDNEIRIVSVTKDLNNLYNVQIGLADSVTPLAIVRQYTQQQKVVTTLVKVEKDTAENARKAYLANEELKEATFNPDGSLRTDKIAPLSIETNMLSVGSRSQQFTLSDITFTLSKDNTSIGYTAGTLAHLTIDPAAVKIWNIAASSISGMDEGLYYLYARCQRNGSNGSFVALKGQIKFDSDAIFWHFLVGIITTVKDGYRQVKTNYGQTVVTGRDVRTGRISSNDGSTYFDLDAGEISGNIKFTEAQKKEITSEVQVGGRNLLSKSNVAREGVYFMGNWELMDDFDGDVVLQMWYESTTPNGGGVALGSASSWDGSYFFLPNFTASSGYLTWSGKLTKGNKTHLWLYTNANTRITKIKLEKGNKATDWTPAPEDVDSAITNIKVGGRNYVLNSDIYITTGDKQMEFADWQNWHGKTVTISADVELVNITTAGRIGFEPSLAFSDGSVMWLRCWHNVAVGDSFKGRISATWDIPDREISTFGQKGIYVQCTGELTKIGHPKLEFGNKATDWTPAPEDVDSAITNIKVGARNLTLNSKTDGTPMGSPAPYGIVSGGLVVGETYTLSFVARKYEDNPWVSVQIPNDWSEGALNIRITIDSTEWKQYQSTFVCKNADAAQRVWVYSAGNYKASIKGGVMLEKGNKATDWTPAPEDVQTEINNLPIIAENLLSNSSFAAGMTGWNINGGNVYPATVDGKTVMYISSTANGNGVYGGGFTKAIKSNTKYTVSFDIRGAYYENLNLRVGMEGAMYDTVAVPNTSEWRRVSYTGTTVSNAPAFPAFVIYGTGARQDFYITNIKVEEYAKATSYLPSTGDPIEIPKIGKTVINGGKILTDLINVNQVRAAMIAAGKITAAEIDVVNLFAQQITATNLTVTGNSKIINGEVGGFTISGNKLSNKALNTSIEFENLSASANTFLRINSSANSSVLAIRTDQVERRAVSLATYARGAKALDIISNSDDATSRAITSYGSHEFVQRGGEIWNAPGVLAAGVVSSSGSITQLWNIGSIQISSSVDRNNQRSYVYFFHGLGHTDYIVQVSSGGIYSKDANTVVVSQERTTTGTLITYIGFNITMIGRNKIM